jgi:predicted TIM-barrel fold metal-dependent hydrolase
VKDESVIAHVEARLARNTYAGIGEFHVFGTDADLPVMRRMTELAAKYGLFLHAHSDADAVRRIFAQDPNARVLWAHSGFVDPNAIRAMLERHPSLWCDLAFRSEHASDGRVAPEWRKLFTDFPDRFMVGTDTFTPERWHYVVEHAEWSRKFLSDLSAPLAEKIARGNARELLGKGAN